MGNMIKNRNINRDSGFNNKKIPKGPLNKIKNKQPPIPKIAKKPFAIPFTKLIVSVVIFIRISKITENILASPNKKFP